MNDDEMNALAELRAAVVEVLEGWQTRDAFPGAMLQSIERLQHASDAADTAFHDYDAE